MYKKALAIFVLLVGISACSLMPTYQRPELQLPNNWSVATGNQPSSGDLPFWQALGNEELTTVMKVALAQNLDLQAALHRIEQARAQAKVAAAPLWPSLDASASVERNYQETAVQSPWRGLTSLSYELDLWGKNRSQALAAKYRMDASQYDREALRLVVSAETAVLYAQALGFRERIRIAETNLKNAEEVLRIIEARFRAGSASGLEVSQQKVAVNTIRASVAALVQQEATTGNALAILLGEAPQTFARPKAKLAGFRVPEVNLNPPASLLTARPDIRSAEAGLLAANADIGAARAAFFPSVKLGVDPSIAAGGFAQPASTALSLATNVLAPIFSGGKLQGNLENVTARQKELAAQYQKTVLTAFKEVEDALAAVENAERQVELSRESVLEAQNAYNIAKARFDAGAIDYLSLLETQRSLSQAEDDQIVDLVDHIQSFVQLRKALGS